jgi:hypothetical protein
MIRLPIFILVWLAFLAIKIPVSLLGVLVVPLLYGYRSLHFQDVPKIFTPWLNPEDWSGGPEGVWGYSLPEWWLLKEGSGFKSFFRYHAIRNPANGLRGIEFLDLDIKPDLIKYYTPRYFRYYEPWFLRRLESEPKTAWYLCWQGWRAGFKFVHLWKDDKRGNPRHFVFKFGWRIEPRDQKEGPDPDGQRAREGAGFASKLIPYRKG